MADVTAPRHRIFWSPIPTLTDDELRAEFKWLGTKLAESGPPPRVYAKPSVRWDYIQYAARWEFRRLMVLEELKKRKVKDG